MTPPLRPPVSGTWLVLNPPGHPRYAFDLVAINETTGRASARSRWHYLAGLTHVEDVYGWSRAVIAPLAGEVVAAHDGERDRRRLVPLRDVPAGFLINPLRHRRRLQAMAGNHIVLATAAGYVLLAHLRAGSITVRVGEQAEAGQQLGVVGNSGNSLGPHLHIQVMDGPDPAAARVVPFSVTRYQVLTKAGREDVAAAPLPRRATRTRFLM